MDTISAVIPCFNREELISSAIDSALAQTEPASEIIVVDDASSDRSIEVVQAWQRRYPDLIKLIALEKNRGVSAARNVGIRYASGRWVAFLDSDDKWLDNHNHELLRVARMYPEARLVFGDCKFENDDAVTNGSWLPEADTAFGRGDVRQLISEVAASRTGVVDRGMLMYNVRASTVPTSGCIVDRDALISIGGFNEAFRSAEDRLCWVSLMVRFQAVYSLNPVSIYRYHRQNATTQAKRAEAIPFIVGVQNYFLSNAEQFGFSAEECAQIRLWRDEIAGSYAYWLSVAGVGEMLQKHASLRQQGYRFSIRDWARGILFSLRKAIRA